MPPVSRERCSPDKHYIGNIYIGVHRLYDIRSCLNAENALRVGWLAGGRYGGVFAYLRAPDLGTEDTEGIPHCRGPLTGGPHVTCRF